jgi:hypothetical protein
MFEALGVGLGRAEMMDVSRAVKRLGEDPRKGVATVRCAQHPHPTVLHVYVRLPVRARAHLVP